jgi:hypothetical protein
MDMLFLLVTVVFFVVAIGYVAACARLVGER